MLTLMQYAVCIAFGLLSVEVMLRIRFASGLNRIPVFAIAASSSLLLFFLAPSYGAPLVRLNPQWCRVSQAITWKLHSGNRFVLVLLGTGNAARYSFDGGYLNYSGSGSAEIRTIRFSPIRFGYDGHVVSIVEADKTDLDRSLIGSGEPQQEIETIGHEVWNLLTRVNNIGRFDTGKFNVGPLLVDDMEAQDLRMGVAIWMFSVLVLFQLMGALSLPRSTP